MTAASRFGDRARRLGAALVAVGLLAGACDSEPEDLEGDLSAAVEATLEEPSAYRVTLEADREALAALGEGSEAAAAFLGSFAIHGTMTPEGGVLRIEVLGRDLLDVRRLSAERTYVRLGVGEIPGVPAALTDPATLLPVVFQLGLGQQVELAVTNLLDGGWVRIDGPLDLARLAAVTDGEAGPEETEGTAADRDADSPAVSGDDLDAHVRRFVDVTGHTQTDARRTFRMDLRLADLVAALSGLSATAADTTGGQDDAVDPPAGQVPETVSGTVFVEDGVVTRVRLDLASLTPDADAQGTIELQLDVEDHGRARLPEQPRTDVALTADEFLDAVATVLRFVAGVGVGGDTP